MNDASMTISATNACPIIGFLLIDGFALMAYASVVEPFRAANVLSGRELYRWINVSVGDDIVRASNGANIVADAKVGDNLAVDTLFVVAGGDPTQFDHRSTFALLRALARQNVPLAGISGGPIILAKAGVLEGYRCTVHWEHASAFEEQFPTLMLEHGLYVIDRGRMTCAGGSAGLDLVTELIEREHGHALAVGVSEWFIRTQPRSADGQQRMSLRERYGVRSDKLLKALARMEANIEEPEPRSALAAHVGVSLRQLERLFASYLGASIGETYLRIRLEHADMLLRGTGMSVTEVGVASGFASSSHFSRAFKKRYGRSPSR